jgi:hypothetical protein
MLSLLLDEQISPVVAEQMAVRRPQIPIASIYRWRHGLLAGSSDHTVLLAAAEDGLTLVTYDLKTIPPLLAEWAGAGTSHAGVVFVDERTIRPADFGRLVRALALLWKRESQRDWQDRTLFLQAT